ncbi:MAG: hypothetical protein ACK5Y2_05075 [Bdellovibrionales bacterium]
MLILRILAVMGIVSGLALSEAQAQSYLSQNRLSFSKRINGQLESIADMQQREFDEPDKVFSLGITMGTRGSRVEDDNIKASTSATATNVDLIWNATTWLRWDLSAGFQFASGQSQAVYGTEGNPYTGPTVNEAAFTLRPSESFDFSAGLVATEFNPILSTFGGDALAGFRQVLRYENGIFKTSLRAYQAVPTQLNQSNRILDETNDSSSIITNMNVGFVGERTELQMSYTKWDFYRMSSAAAGDSRFLGNTMVGDGSGRNMFFQYRFQGREVAAGFAQKFRLDDRLSLKGTMIQNDEAPEKRNLGWMTQTSYLYNFGRYSFRPAVTRFRLEPDVIPAFYSIGTYGFTNRDGYAGELRGMIRRYKIEGFVRFVDAKEVEPRFVQSDRVGYTLGMEVKYEIL